MPKGNETWKWVVGLLLAACGFLVAGFGGYIKGEVGESKSHLERHEKKEGHPIVVERIKYMKKDIEEIKFEQKQITKGVNELLRRVPDPQGR